MVTECINEIEARGLMSEGIYRVPGSKDQVVALKLAFERGELALCSRLCCCTNICACMSRHKCVLHNSWSYIFTLFLLFLFTFDYFVSITISSSSVAPYLEKKKVESTEHD